MKSFFRYLAYVLLGLVILIGIVYAARVPLLNYGLKQIPEELGIAARVERIDLSLLRRSVSIGGIRAKLQEPDLELAVADIAIVGIFARSVEEAGFDTLKIAGVNVKLKDAEETIDAQVSRIDLSGAHYLSGDVSVEQGAVEGVATQLSQWPEPQVKLAGFVVKQVEYLAAGEVKVASVGLTDLAANAQALAKNISIKQLDLDGVQFIIETLSTKLASVGLDGLVYAEADAPDQPPLVNLAKLTITGIDVPKPTSIQINNILFPGGEVYIVRNADGQINLLPPLPEEDLAKQDDQSVSAGQEVGATEDAGSAAATETVEVEATAAETTATGTDTVTPGEQEALSWSLLGFQLAAPLTIHFSDFSFEPVLKETITFTEITLAHAHNAASGEPLTAKVRADIGKAGKLKLDASALVATASESFDVDLDLNDVELQGLSGFSQQATGYAIESGQASLDVKVKARKKQLKGEANVDLYRVVLRVEDAETSDKLAQELSMPLQTALYLLQDDDDRIELKVPIEGDMDSPDFSPSGFMALITKKALKKASVYYLKNTLFPGNLLIDAVSLVGGSVYAKFTAVPPMEFIPGSPELSPANMKTLEQLVELLTKKKKLTVRLCSVAVAADGEDKATALKMADQRSELARQWLLERQVAPKRLLSCLSRYDSEAPKPLLLMQL